MRPPPFIDFCEQPSLFCSGITKQTEKINFSSIDISNVETLKIETTNEGEYSCGWLYIVDDILSVHTRRNGDWIVKTEATCIKTGQKVQYCTECGEICVSEPIPANGHKVIDEWIETVPSTCATPGKEVQYCSVCGDIVKTRPIDCLPHIEGKEWEILTETSCTDVGERVTRCIECNAIIETEPIEKIPHDFGEWLVTSQSVGSSPSVESRSCTQCGLLETREIESKRTQWLIYIFIGANIAIVIITSFVYPLKFIKILTIDIICHHALLIVLMLCYNIDLSLLFFIELASAIMCVLPLELISIFSSELSILGVGILFFFKIQNMPGFVALNFLYAAIVVYLKKTAFKCYTHMRLLD